MSLLGVCQILGLFVNTLIADDKYSLGYTENLSRLFEMQLSKKQKTFLSFQIHFWNSHHNIWKNKIACWCFYEVYIKVWTLSKKDNLHRSCISEITDCKRPG